MQQQYYNNQVTPTEDVKKVHIKVQFGNDIRRFSLNAGSYDYASLVQYIKRLFDFPVDSEIVLKYKDDESDMIIISSNEELKFAIELFSVSTALLRLTIFQKNATSVPQEERGGFRGGRGGQWGGPHLGKKIEKMTKKRDELNEKLKEMGPNSPPKLEAKIACIDKRIAKMKEFMDNRSQNQDVYHHPHHPIHQHWQHPGSEQHSHPMFHHHPQQFQQQMPPFMASPPFWGPTSAPSSAPPEEFEAKWGRGGGRGCGGRGRGGRGRWANDPVFQQMWALRKEKKALKRALNEGSESDKNAKIKRIDAIKKQLWELREKKRAEHNTQ